MDEWLPSGQPKARSTWDLGRGFGRGIWSRRLASWRMGTLAACSSMGPFGPIPPREPAPPILPDAAGEVLGTGPVRVALLLPLSGDPALSTVGTSMANSARIAMQYIAGNAALPDNITIVLKDTGPTAAAPPPRPARRSPRARA